MSVGSLSESLSIFRKLFVKKTKTMCVWCSKKKTCALYGKWTECLYAVDAAAFEAHKKNNKKVTEEKKVREVRLISDRQT